MMIREDVDYVVLSIFECYPDMKWKTAFKYKTLREARNVWRKLGTNYRVWKFTEFGKWCSDMTPWNIQKNKK